MLHLLLTTSVEQSHAKAVQGKAAQAAASSVAMQVGLHRRFHRGAQVEGVFSPPLSQQRHALLLDLVARCQAAQLLDLGCGEGTFLHYMRCQVRLSFRLMTDSPPAVLPSERHTAFPA